MAGIPSEVIALTASRTYDGWEGFGLGSHTPFASQALLGRSFRLTMGVGTAVEVSAIIHLVHLVPLRNSLWYGMA